MKWAQLQAILWIRWRMFVHRIKRRGKFGHALLGLILVFALLVALSNLVAALLIGYEVLSENEMDPRIFMFAWVAVTAMLMFGWMVGVMTELQRAESMSFQSLLHLPTSLLGVHIYNYIGSFVSLSLFIFLPIMLGLAAAAVLALGWHMLLLFPLIAGFLCLLTALTYQLRGWLGTMMSNPRKRKNVVALITISFVLLAQVPNAINLSFSRSRRAARQETQLVLGNVAPTQPEASQPDALEPAPGVGEPEAARESDAAEAGQAAVKDQQPVELDEKQAFLALADKWAAPVCLAVPFGWLAYGARSLVEDRWIYALLLTLGLFGLTGLSLRRSYRTTLRFVTGVGSASVASPSQAPAAAPNQVLGAPGKALFVARELPFVSEEVSCIGLAGVRNLWRAPEFKLLLLVPMILLLLGVVMFFTGTRPEVPRALRPLLGLGGISVGLICMLQLIQNQFGMDRQGFRAFLLSPIERQRILMGKNLAAAPFAIGIGLLGIIGSQVFMPMGAEHLLATLLLSPAAFLLVSMAGNLVSILSPMRFKENAMQPANAKLKVVLIQLASFFMLPVILLPIFLPMGLESLAKLLDLEFGLPIYLLTSLLVLAGSSMLYRVVLHKQGRMFQAREQRILEVLTRASD